MFSGKLQYTILSACHPVMFFILIITIRYSLGKDDTLNGEVSHTRSQNLIQVYSYSSDIGCSINSFIMKVYVFIANKEALILPIEWKTNH